MSDLSQRCYRWLDSWGRMLHWRMLHPEERHPFTEEEESELAGILRDMSLAKAPREAERPHFSCPDCGVCAVDEDGCCRTCGRDVAAVIPADSST